MPPTCSLLTVLLRTVNLFDGGSVKIPLTPPTISSKVISEVILYAFVVMLSTVALMTNMFAALDVLHLLMTLLVVP